MSQSKVSEDKHDNGPLYIDLPAVLQSKLGRKARFVPDWLVHRLENYICVERLNLLLRKLYPRTGSDFCQGVLDDLDITVDVVGAENLPDPSHRKVLFACNHPLGGADGMALIKFMHDYYGGEVYVVVNDLLMAIEPLREVFVPVNKHGAQRHSNSRRFEEVMESDNPVLFFPAGLVSRLHDDGDIKDLTWKTTFVNKAIQTGRDIVPLFFSGQNSRGFYKMARRRNKLGLKFNIEMLRLPRELLMLQSSHLTIYCVHAVECRHLEGGAHARDTVERIRQACYSLQPKGQK